MRNVPAAIFRFIAKPVSVFFAILFVLVTCLVLLLFNGERTLLNAGTYKRALAENGVYNQLPVLAQGEMEALKTFLTSQAGIATGDMNFTNNLSTDDWQYLLPRLLPPDEARGMVENALDQGFAALNGETDTARLSLVTLKAHLKGPEGKDSIQYLLKVQPACTEEQLAEIHAEKAGNTEAPPFCNPPQQDLALLTTQWQAQLDSRAAGIPDEVSILPPSGPSDAGSPVNASLARLNTQRFLIRFSPLLSLILLTLLTLFAVRSLKGWLRWWGIPFFITGLIVMVIALSIRPLLNWVWVNSILPQFPSTLSAGLTGLAGNLVGSVGRALATPIMLQAAIIGLLGLAAIIASFFIKVINKEPVPLAPRDAA
jgi:hypothetical protein